MTKRRNIDKKNIVWLEQNIYVREGQKNRDIYTRQVCTTKDVYR